VCQLCALWVSLLWLTAPLSLTPYCLLLLRYLCSCSPLLASLPTIAAAAPAGRISRLGGRAGVRFKHESAVAASEPIPLFVWFRCTSDLSPGRAPARCNIRSSRRSSNLFLCTATSLLWAVCRCCCGQVWDSAAVLCSSCFLLLVVVVVVVVVVWSPCEHLV
jgi:hypothetical protein